MQPLAARRRDPALAALFSAVVPGAGLLYADEFRPFVVVLIVEAALFGLGWWLPLVVLHVLQIAVAAGTAAASGERGRDVFTSHGDATVTDVGNTPPDPT